MAESPLPEFPIDPDLPLSEGPKAPASRRWDVVLVIAAGGALGAAARELLNLAIPTAKGGFPWSTFLENTLGSLLLGVVMVLVLDVWRPNRYARPFLGVGVLGGFTTFSTYSAETEALLREGRAPLALTYFFGTMLVGLLAVWIGLTCTRWASGVTRRTAS